MIVVNGDVYVVHGQGCGRAATLGTRLAVASCQGPVGSVLAVAAVMIGAAARLLWATARLIYRGGRATWGPVCRWVRSGDGEVAIYAVVVAIAAVAGVLLAP